MNRTPRTCLQRADAYITKCDSAATEADITQIEQRLDDLEEKVDNIEIPTVNPQDLVPAHLFFIKGFLKGESVETIIDNTGNRVPDYRTRPLLLVNSDVDISQYTIVFVRKNKTHNKKKRYKGWHRIYNFSSLQNTELVKPRLYEVNHKPHLIGTKNGFNCYEIVVTSGLELSVNLQTAFTGKVGFAKFLNSDILTDYKFTDTSESHQELDPVPIWYMLEHKKCAFYLEKDGKRCSEFLEFTVVDRNIGHPGHINLNAIADTVYSNISFEELWEYGIEQGLVNATTQVSADSDSIIVSNSGIPDDDYSLLRSVKFKEGDDIKTYNLGWYEPELPSGDLKYYQKGTLFVYENRLYQVNTSLSCSTILDLLSISTRIFPKNIESYNSIVDYKLGDLVLYKNNVYINIQPCSNKETSNTAYWKQIGVTDQILTNDDGEVTLQGSSIYIISTSGGKIYIEDDDLILSGEVTVGAGGNSDGDLIVNNNATISNNLRVNGGTSLFGSLYVDGSINLADGDLIIGGGGEVTVDVPLTVNNDVNVTNDLSVDNNVSIAGNLSVDNITSHSTSISLAQTLALEGDLEVIIQTNSGQSVINVASNAATIQTENTIIVVNDDSVLINVYDSNDSSTAVLNLTPERIRILNDYIDSLLQNV